jgi:hypothetical protein
MFFGMQIQPLSFLLCETHLNFSSSALPSAVFASIFRIYIHVPLSDKYSCYSAIITKSYIIFFSRTSLIPLFDLPICPMAHSEARLFRIWQLGSLISSMKLSRYLVVFSNSTPFLVLTNSPNICGGIFDKLLLFSASLKVTLT